MTRDQINFRIVGPCRGPTGYDNQVRQLCKGLAENKRLFEFYEFAWGPVSLPQDWLSPLSQTQPPLLVKPGVTLHFVMPPQVQPCNDTYNVNFTMFEASTIPREWALHSMQHDHVIVPTASSANAWIRSGVSEDKISICPLGIDSEIFKPGIPAGNIGRIRGKAVHEYRTRLLNISDFIPRKNITGLLLAWLDATTDADDAVLILKACLYQHELYNWLQNEIRAMERRTGKTFEKAAPVFWITDVLHPAAMPSLYAVATHYISMSHGEGWDLPMMEAGACGLQLIAPRHSAYENWMDERWTCFIPSYEIDVPHFYPPTLLSGLRFWQPEHDAAVDIIKQAVKGQQLCSQSAAEAIRGRFTWANTTKQVLNIIDNVYGRGA